MRRWLCAGSDSNPDASVSIRWSDRRRGRADPPPLLLLNRRFFLSNLPEGEGFGSTCLQRFWTDAFVDIETTIVTERRNIPTLRTCRSNYDAQRHGTDDRQRGRAPAGLFVSDRKSCRMNPLRVDRFPRGPLARCPIDVPVWRQAGLSWMTWRGERKQRASANGQYAATCQALGG